VTNASGCTSDASNTEVISIHALPIPLASNNGPICNGDDATLTGNSASGATYEWYDAAYTTLLSTNAIHTVIGLTADADFNFIITVNGCSDTATTAVVVSPIPAAPNITASATSVCEGDAFTLTSTTAADSYSWTGPNGYTSNLQMPLSIVGSPQSAGTYTLIVTVNGCTSLASTETITVNPNPTAPVLVATNSVCDGESLMFWYSNYNRHQHFNCK